MPSTNFPFIKHAPPTPVPIHINIPFLQPFKAPYSFSAIPAHIPSFLVNASTLILSFIIFSTFNPFGFKLHASIHPLMDVPRGANSYHLYFYFII